MPTTIRLLAAALLLTAPAFAQTTTTVTTDPQAAPPPPPPSTTTTIQTQPTTPAPPAVTEVETGPRGRTAVSIVAMDAVYGGIAGGVIGGGITLINNGDHWQRDLMVGAGVGILVGGAFGIYEATQLNATVVRRASSDRDPAANDVTKVPVFAARF